MKLLPCISFEKCVYILALEMASPGNQHCVNCIGTPSFPIKYPEEYPVVVVEMSPECGRPFSVWSVEFKRTSVFKPSSPSFADSLPTGTGNRCAVSWYLAAVFSLNKPDVTSAMASARRRVLTAACNDRSKANFHFYFLRTWHIAEMFGVNEAKDFTLKIQSTF